MNYWYLLIEIRIDEIIKLKTKVLTNSYCSSCLIKKKKTLTKYTSVCSLLTQKLTEKKFILRTKWVQGVVTCEWIWKCMYGIQREKVIDFIDDTWENWYKIKFCKEIKKLKKKLAFHWTFSQYFYANYDVYRVYHVPNGVPALTIP